MPDQQRPPAAWLPRITPSPLIRRPVPPTWPSLTSSSRTISSPRRISTACTISFPLVLTATRSVMRATGITGAAASGAQAGTIGGSDGAAGPVRSSGRSYSGTSAPSPSGRTVITIRSGPLVRISFLSASSPPDLISGLTTGTRGYSGDYYGGYAGTYSCRHTGGHYGRHPGARSAARSQAYQGPTEAD